MHKILFLTLISRAYLQNDNVKIYLFQLLLILMKEKNTEIIIICFYQKLIVGFLASQMEINKIHIFIFHVIDVN